MKHAEWPQIIYNETRPKRKAWVEESYDPSTVPTVLEACQETERLLELATDWADGDVFKQVVIGILKLIHLRLQVRAQ